MSHTNDITWADVPVDDGHRQMLIESGITPPVALPRYESAYGSTGQRMLKEAGFKGLKAAGLLIRQYGLDGYRTYSQYRPDTPIPDPRNPTKARRYLNPPGSHRGLDFHPHIVARVLDASVPLWLTEGTKKTDALISAGECCIGLPDVNGAGRMVPHPEGLIGRNGQPLKVFQPHPEWEQIPLEGRLVFIVFDSDVMTKPAVYAALRRLNDFLKVRGAR